MAAISLCKTRNKNSYFPSQKVRLAGFQTTENQYLSISKFLQMAEDIMVQ